MGDWLECTIVTAAEAVESISDVLMEAGAEGVVIDDPRTALDWKPQTPDELWLAPQSRQEQTEDVTIRAYFPRHARKEDLHRHVLQRIQRAKEAGLATGAGTVAFSLVREEDWATAWQAYYHVLRIGERLVIRPSWEEFEARPEDVVIDLDPGMAFGTGTHETTQLCLEALEKYVSQDEAVADVGTGSGVLAIAAGKLGASRVSACDLAETAVEVARTNIDRNALNEVVLVELGGPEVLLDQGPFTVVVANIVADVILSILSELVGLLDARGRLLLCGIVAEREDDIVRAVKSQGLVIDEIKGLGEWRLVHATKKD